MHELYQVDQALYIHTDDAAVAADGFGQVDGATATLNVGRGLLAHGAVVVVNVQTAAQGFGDYGFELVGSIDQWATEETLAILPVPEGVTGTQNWRVSNMFFGTLYTSLRLRHLVPAGGSMTYRARMSNRIPRA